MKEYIENIKPCELISLDGLKQAFVDYLCGNLGCDEEEAASMVNKDWDCPGQVPYVVREEEGEYKIGTEYYAVRSCRTDFCKAGLFELEMDCPFEYLALAPYNPLSRSGSAKSRGADEKYYIVQYGIRDGKPITAGPYSRYIIRKACKSGLMIRERLPAVMEVSALSTEICNMVMYGTRIQSRLDEKTACLQLSRCFYAGAGAVYHWKKDRRELERRGAYALLTAPRGLEGVDAYVTEALGMKFGSAESDKLVRFLHYASKKAWKDMRAQYRRTHDVNQYTAITEAMYLAGMAFALDRPGIQL